MKLAAFSLNDLLTLKLVLAKPYSSLIFIEYFLVLTVFILFLTELVPVVLSNAKNLSLLTEVQAVLKTC